MSKNNIIIAICIFALFSIIIIAFIRDHIGSVDSLALLTNKDPIEKIELIIITSPTFPNKRVFTITNTKILDSLNGSFRQQLEPVNVTIAKLNNVFAIIYIYKSKKKIQIDVVSSNYTGWVMKVGPKSFSDEYMFNLVKTYL